MENNKITFVIPSRNNLEFLQLAYKAIRKKLKTRHHILILDDASIDGTKEWVEEESKKCPELKIYTNEGPERIGIVGMFDKGIEMAETDIIFAFHADMVITPNFDKNILKYLDKGIVVSATRVEPPLHPSGPEKITANFGIEVDEFNEDKFDKWFLNTYKPKHDVKFTEGIFAPWCMYKSDYLAIGGHDKLFAPQSKEDSDLFNRFILKGYEVIQSWEALVYHFTSRGSRFNKYAGGAAGKNSEEWLYTTNKNMRNFIRKWGHFVKHDEFMKPIIPSKYNVGFIIENGDSSILAGLEPWCDTIYIDPSIIKSYVETEQVNTIIDLSKRVLPFDNEKNNEVLVTIDTKQFTEQDFNIIQQLPEIIKDSGEKGEFELNNLKIEIFKLNTYEKELIICKS